MSDVEKLKIGSTSYDITDAAAAHDLTDIASQGDGIKFEQPTTPNYTVSGTLTIENNDVATGFSTANFVYKQLNLSTATSMTLTTCVIVPTLSANKQVWNLTSTNYLYFQPVFFTDGKLGWYNNGSIKGTTTYQAGQKVWLRLIWTGTAYTLYALVDNGYTLDDLPNISSWTAEVGPWNSYDGEGSTAMRTNPVSGNLNLGYGFIDGTIYLSQTELIVDGELYWRAAAPISGSKTSIIADIATSVNSSSTNKQSVGAKLFYDTCGDIETLINAL